MASGIFKIYTNTKEIKAKEVEVRPEGLVDENSGEIVSFAEVFKPFEGMVVNFSIKITTKEEADFEVEGTEE